MSDLIVNFITFCRERPKMLLGVFVGILGAILFFDFLAVRHVPHFAGDNIRTFWAMFGFFGCILMTKIMKGMGHAFLMQPLDFYSSKKGGEE